MTVATLVLGIVAAALGAGVVALWIARQRLLVEAIRLREEARSARENAVRLERDHEQAISKIESLARDAAAAREQAATLQTRLEDERQAHEEKIRVYEEARLRMLDTFKAASAEALRSNNDEFLKRAKELLESTHSRATEDFAQRQKAINDLIQPIRESLKAYEEKLGKIEKDRVEANARIGEQIEMMRLANEQLKSEAGNLVKALRRPEVRGTWGELTLRRLVELAGMVQHCDFCEQEHTRTADGAIRPDAIVNLPNYRRLIIDAKAPLDAYLAATECHGKEQEEHLQRHARQIRGQVDLLARKAYWAQFDDAPDFVIMFVPGDTFLWEAYRLDPDLLEYALQRKVVPATPATLIALLKAVAYGWHQERAARNAQSLLEHGREMHDRLKVFVEHMDKVGTHLGAAVDAYNRMIGSYDERIMPQARRFEEMGVTSDGTLRQPELIDSRPRESRNLLFNGGERA